MRRNGAEVRVAGLMEVRAKSTISILGTDWLSYTSSQEKGFFDVHSRFSFAGVRFELVW